MVVAKLTVFEGKCVFRYYFNCWDKEAGELGVDAKKESCCCSHVLKLVEQVVDRAQEHNALFDNFL